MRLPAGTTSGRGLEVEYEKVFVLHATVNVYHPAPDGASYTNTATCTHRHPDTEKGRADTEGCAASLRRIIDSGRLPKWATLTYPLPEETP